MTFQVVDKASTRSRGIMALVSYDLAVREGDRPADDAAAGQEYRRLSDRYIGSRDLQPPTPRIAVGQTGLLRPAARKAPALAREIDVPLACHNPGNKWSLTCPRMPHSCRDMRHWQPANLNKGRGNCRLTTLRRLGDLNPQRRVPGGCRAP